LGVVIVTGFVTTGCGVVEEGAVVPTTGTEEAVSADKTPKNPFGPPVALSESDHQEAFEMHPEWAPPTEFESRWNDGTEPWRILHCGESTLAQEGTTLETGPTLLLRIGAEGPWFGGVTTAEGDLTWLLHRAEWAVTDETDSSVVLRAADQGAEFECRQARFEDPRPVEHSYATWVYSATLLNPPEPVYVDIEKEHTDHERERIANLRNGPWSLELVERLLELSPHNRDAAWGSALSWAKAHGDDDLVYELYRRYRPVGRCSQDSRPQRVKREFAEFCAKTGRTRCELVLMTHLIAYNIPRVSDMWMGGKPVSYESELHRLPGGLDVPRFMLGLLVDYPGTTGNEAASISPQFFALATYGTPHADALMERLEAWLADPELDTWNRHRIALTLFLLRAYRRSTESASKHAAAVAQLEGVPEITKLQLGRVE
jgi:hypothetical protein